MDPRYAVVSVMRRGDNLTAGAGVLLTPQHLITCAHVVNDALGRPVLEHRPPGGVVVEVALRTPSTVHKRRARVEYWIPPRRRDGGLPVREKRDHDWYGDLAVLAVDRAGDIPAPPPEWAPMEPGQRLRAWHSTGLGSTFADVRVKSLDGAVAYVDGESTGMAIGPAYSGGPLWSVDSQVVVGVVTGHIMPPADPVSGRPLPYGSQQIARRSWGIPWQTIQEELRAVGAAGLFEDTTAEADPGDPALPLLADLLATVMSSPEERRERARAVAERCGYTYPRDGTGPGNDEFARLLVTDPRALAALSEVMRLRDPSATERILQARLLSQVPLLLSPREFDRLRSHLEQLPGSLRARLPQAMRAALPLAAVLPDGERLEETLTSLERLSGDSHGDPAGPRVPGLLRVVEYLAVLCAGSPRALLRLWSDGVADRLGIPRSALAERRSDAEEWARTQGARAAPLRVLVQVRTLLGVDRYQLRLWCDEGAGPRQVSTDGERVYSGAQAAREVLRALESLCRAADPGERRPLVEALVDRAGLNLPIDEWETDDPDDVVPAVLGAEYQVVVNCPELLRRNERFLPDWRRRWRQLDTGTSLLFNDSAMGTREIYGTLMDRADAVRVAVTVPAGLREEIVQVCLAVGVPVVVWDRAGESQSEAVEQMGVVSTRELPEGVRSYRAKTVHRPRDYPGRPVLAWADADRTVPQLYLAEPQESA
ncbi:trypsin-like peptidase domain-containing protein [Streptomyces sp. ADI97-07]|uniref:VMAP-C domain-containing protein n=1 Tax=Streptomyces sp. ADI97-07 TaxID=1522762 RepID=UPI001F15271B|nr:trypsin-like peptidase domain-containing protein [Streptomyces sp. ADI97-07]